LIREKIVLFANTDWYLYNFRRSLAAAIVKSGRSAILLSPDGPYGEQLRQMGFDWKALPMQRRSLNPFRELLLIIHLIRLFRREKPALVHSFTIKAAIYGSIAARLAGVPAQINAVAGMGYVFISSDLRARILRPLVRLLLRFVLNAPGSMLVLQNDDDVELFLEAGLVSRDRIRLIRGSGVDCSRFTPPRSRDAHAPVRVVLATRLLWDKGLAEFVEAARALRREGRRIEFIVAGTPDSGNPASASDEDIATWVSEGVVDWRGHVEDMPALFQQADIVVLPSYREGLPKSLIEAAACEAALVTTDVTGCREVVSHDVDGLLVPVRNAQAIADAIRRLHEDPALRRRLGVAARGKALREFDERIVIEKTLAVHEELLQRRRSL
jgi:glycosyltransferase involved in cell wall biosynthesis